MCFVWISEQTAIISLYSINWLVFSCVRKIAKNDSVVTSVRPSVVSGEQLRSHLKDFHEIWYLSIIWKSTDNIQLI